MTRPKRTEEDPFPMRTLLCRLLKARGCPDPHAKIVGKDQGKTLGPGREYVRVRPLHHGDQHIGVKVVHRRPTKLQKFPIHTTKPDEMLIYLEAALAS